MLNNKFKEALFAFTAFGPNMLMTMLVAYYVDAMDTSGLTVDIGKWSVAGYPLVLGVVFGVLWTIGRIFDGVVDVPLASLSDKFKTKYKRLAMPILMGTVPMIVFFFLSWTPFSKAQGSLFNTIWLFFMLLIYFSAYTFVLIAFYGSMSTVCKDQAQRARVSAFKSIFDTVQYAIAYAVIPLMLGIGIQNIMYMFAPMMLTILIPVFLLRPKKPKKNATLEEIEHFKKLQEAEAKVEANIERVPLFKSLCFVFKNKAFLAWLLTNVLTSFALQLFLIAQNVLISSVLQLDAIWATVLNSCAFGPVPLMMFIFYKLMKKKGIRFAFQTTAVVFAIAILGFFFGSVLFFPKDTSTGARIAIAAIGSVIGSYSVGSFFALPLIIPAQIAAVELKITKKNNSAMYFAGQALVTTIASAIGTGIVYSNIKGIFIENANIQGTIVESFPLGGLIVVGLISFFCLAAFGTSFLMPKDYDVKTIGKYFDKNYVYKESDENLDMSAQALLEKEESEEKTQIQPSDETVVENLDIASQNE